MLEVNEYFDGKVKSIAFQTSTLPATVGVMSPGEYTFSTSQNETMTIVSDELIVLLPKSNSWVTYKQGDEFYIPADCSFQIKVAIETAYLCTYE